MPDTQTTTSGPSQLENAAAAFKAAIEPLVAMFGERLSALEASLDRKHAENSDKRHSHAEKVQEAVDVISESQVAIVRRVEKLEGQNLRMLGREDGGNSGLLNDLKEGQDKISAQVETLTASIAADRERKAGKDEQRQSLMFWMKLIAASGAAVSAIVVLIHFLNMLPGGVTH